MVQWEQRPITELERQYAASPWGGTRGQQCAMTEAQLIAVRVRLNTAMMMLESVADVVRNPGGSLPNDRILGLVWDARDTLEHAQQLCNEALRELAGAKSMRAPKPPREVVPVEFIKELGEDEFIRTMMRGYFDHQQCRRIYELTGRDPDTAPERGEDLLVHDRAYQAWRRYRDAYTRKRGVLLRRPEDL